MEAGLPMTLFNLGIIENVLICCKQRERGQLRIHGPLLGWKEASNINYESEITALSLLRKIPTVNEKKIHFNLLWFFNRLIIIAQRNMTVETS
jgi:hypothetical protein